MAQPRDPAAPILRGSSSRFGPWLVPACREVLANLRSLKFLVSFRVGRPRESGRCRVVAGLG
eukprot:6495542-Alexandrium_andersonii.AAC.1